MSLDAKGQISEAVADAEDIRDPLECLIERTGTNPGAPFESEMIECLAALKKADPARFETLRAGLKKIGCRVGTLDDAIAERGTDRGGRRPNQADTLIRLAESAELFHSPDKTGFADISIDGHRET